MRSIRNALVAVALVTTALLWPSPSRAAERAGGTAAADVQTSYVQDAWGGWTGRVDYPAIKFFGTVTVGGATYTGGFWVNGISWSYPVYGFCPVAPPMGPCSGFVLEQPDVGGLVPEGATLSGEDLTGQHIGGFCGGSGSSAEMIAGATHRLHLGCGIAVDGHQGGWVWFDVEMAGAGGVVSGVYTASS